MTDIPDADILNSFDPGERSNALTGFLKSFDPPATGSNVNMHLHSFFSFNSQGASPTRLAWDARNGGLYAAGLCDFDVLDGLEEFLEAGRRLTLRTAVSLETRACFEEYGDVEINSPGEPGITYIMGAGFANVPSAESSAGRVLADLRQQASQRNRDLTNRINARATDLSIDYDRDVAPLSPGGCPTERHIIRACCLAVASHGHEKAAEIWARILDMPPRDLQTLIANPATLEDVARTKLIKRGGLAYVPPTPAMFPSVDVFARCVLDARAIPTATWLDGCSEGERDPAAMLECLRDKGVAAVNIVPDRNWNIADAEMRLEKIAHLRTFIATAGAMDLPINIGTEMNKDGQPFYDDLNGEILREFAQPFVQGARVMVGQTLLARYADYAYCDECVAADFKNRKQRNRFFAAVGSLPPLSTEDAQNLATIGPTAVLDRFRKAVS